MTQKSNGVLVVSSIGADVASDGKARSNPELDDNMKATWAQSDIVLNDLELRIQGHPVMEAWEHPYMKRLAEIATQNGGQILELGFGMGISATYIQEVGRNLTTHHIVEANNKVAANADKWAVEKASSKVVVHRGYSWDVAPSLRDGFFDGILYDTYPLEPGKAGKHHRDFLKDAARLLRPGGIFTYFCSVFPAEERQLLNDHGFEVTTEWVPVPTPPDCQYFDANHLIAPICVKKLPSSKRRRRCAAWDVSEDDGDD